MKLNFFRWSTNPATSKQKTLVLLHGMGGTGQIWRPLAAQLEETYLCIAPDQRGHGKSRPVPFEEKDQYHVEDYARDVSLLLDSLGIESYFLIGHSMGVRTALALAKREPKKAKGVIAIDIGISRAWGGGIGIPLAHFLKNLPEVFPSRNELKAYLNQHCPDPSIGQYLAAVAQSVPGTLQSAWTFPFDHLALVKTIEQAHEAPLDEWLKEALNQGVPFTFLRGANSKVWSKSDYESQKTLLAHPLLHFEEWENCGHGLPFEQRARLIEEIRALF